MMKGRLLLKLVVAGLLCSCTTTDNSMRTQPNTEPQIQPLAPAPLRPGHN